MALYETPQAALEAYVEGSRAMDVALLRTCFHPFAVMNGYLMGKQLLGGPEPFFQDVAGMPGRGVTHAAFEGGVEDVVATGKIARGTVRMKKLADALDFRDDMHLIEDEGGWRIISKVFTSLD